MVGLIGFAGDHCSSAASVPANGMVARMQSMSRRRHRNGARRGARAGGARARLGIVAESVGLQFIVGNGARGERRLGTMPRGLCRVGIVWSSSAGSWRPSSSAVMSRRCCRLLPRGSFRGRMAAAGLTRRASLTMTLSLRRFGIPSSGTGRASSTTAFLRRLRLPIAVLVLCVRRFGPGDVLSSGAGRATSSAAFLQRLCLSLAVPAIDVRRFRPGSISSARTGRTSSTTSLRRLPPNLYFSLAVPAPDGQRGFGTIVGVASVAARSASPLTVSFLLRVLLLQLVEYGRRLGLARTSGLFRAIERGLRQRCVP